MAGVWRLLEKLPTPIVSVAEAKRHCNVDFDDDDDLFGALVATATDRLDLERGILGRPLLTQQWEYTAPAPLASGSADARLRGLPPSAGFILDRAPNLTLLAVEALTGGLYVALDMASLALRRVSSETSFLRLGAGRAWPVYDVDEAAWRIRVSLGYGATPADVPAPIRAAALLIIGHLYANREAVAGYGAALQETPMGVEALLAPYRKPQF